MSFELFDGEEARPRRLRPVLEFLTLFLVILAIVFCTPILADALSTWIWG